jgi:Winged helix DNA-binding domain
MLALTAPHIKVSMSSMNKQLELDASIFNKCNDIIEKTLANGNHLTREEIMAQIAESGIMVSPQRASHLMMFAELEGIVCNGIMKNKQHTYSLLSEKILKKRLVFSREEALATLAKRFFVSHGPATLQDFSWWSGLPMGDVRKGLESIKNELISETFDNQTYWFSPDTKSTEKESVYFLPSFDEFMISYKDRSASIEAHLKAQVMTSNGIFKPIIVVNGKVVGIWKRTIRKDKLLIEPQFFYSDKKLNKDEMMKATEKLGKFWDLEIEIL